MPKYILTARRPADEPLNPDAAPDWMQWFDDLGEHLVEFRGPLVPVRSLGNCSGGQHAGGFTVITAEDEDQAIAFASSSPALKYGQGVEIAELVEVPAAA